MKRVRFFTPANAESVATMNESDCQSPRPFVHRNLECQAPEIPAVFAKEIVYSPDPVRRFECSNGSPFPLANKTTLPEACDQGKLWSPCNDLELSLLDSGNQQPRKPVYYTPFECLPNHGRLYSAQNVEDMNLTPDTPKNVLSPIQNTEVVTPPNVLNRCDNFFITRGGLNKFQLRGSVQVQMNKLSLGKENNPTLNVSPPLNKSNVNVNPGTHIPNSNFQQLSDTCCKCHHCVRVDFYPNFNTSTPGMHCGNKVTRQNHVQNVIQSPAQPICNQEQTVPPPTSNQCMCTQQPKQMTAPQNCNIEPVPPKPQNAVDKRAWIIEKYEQAKNECTDVEKQMNISKEKREPTVGDLLKIIKLQNEQLQLLQEKVDKLISSNNCVPKMPMHNIMAERVAVETVEHEQHKISIGVMTSLEMVRTSTIINKEQIGRQTIDNAQIQCNRSEISIKEVVKQPVNLNFLDGILPVGKAASLQDGVVENVNAQQMSNCNEEKTLNDLSLYNVQVDNAASPVMSPEQSLYLDVREYSSSDSDSDQSNVGWTYYNKVMTHVNGMLQDSDMPSSASALYRNTRQHCLQMQIDKTNISVTKRVTFGDDPMVLQQPLMPQMPHCSGTDTSMKMNQLAAKYLKTAPSVPPPSQPPSRQNEMSIATRNYMERHKLIQGHGSSSRRAPVGEMPRFLDITTLKQQPKLL